MGNEPIKRKLIAYPGITLTEQWIVKDGLQQKVDMTGWSGRMYVAPDYGQTSIIELPTANATITFPARGIVKVRIESSVTEGFAVGNYKYDLEVEDGSGEVYPISYGTFQVKNWLTQEP